MKIYNKYKNPNRRIDKSGNKLGKRHIPLWLHSKDYNEIYAYQKLIKQENRRLSAKTP